MNCNCENCCILPVSHTVKEWAELPDEISKKNVWYVYSDYRTDNDVSVPRFKFGDGVTLISKLPFVTAAITDNDMEFWDNKEEVANNFGDEVFLNDCHNDRMTFPCDGYLVLRFFPIHKLVKRLFWKKYVTTIERATVRIYGAKHDKTGMPFFVFSKSTEQEAQSKEVFVRKGMKCRVMDKTEYCTVSFVPLV